MSRPHVHVHVHVQPINFMFWRPEGTGFCLKACWISILAAGDLKQGCVRSFKYGAHRWRALPGAEKVVNEMAHG
jgi:hypothetical protein